MSKKRGFFSKYLEFLKISKAVTIAERYFTMTVFDAIMVTLGIIIANYIVGIYDTRIVITACFGAAIAMTVSGVWGAYITERAERCGEVKKLERATSLTLKDSPIEKAHKFASIFLALINGLSPIIIAFIILIPVLLVPAFSVMLAYQMSMAIAFITLFVLGASLGRISKENVLICGVEMLLTGVACVIILFLLGV